MLYAKTWLTEDQSIFKIFKATTVKPANMKGVLKQGVAESLDIHPCMLSRWIKEVREGKIVAKGKKVELDTETVTGLKRLKR